MSLCAESARKWDRNNSRRRRFKQRRALVIASVITMRLVSTRSLAKRLCAGRRVRPVSTGLEAERKLSLVSVSRVRSTRHRHEELLRRVIRSFCVLDKEYVLPLQKSRQTEVESHGMGFKVGCRPCAKVVVGK